MSSGLASGGSKGVAWSGKDGDFVDQLVDLRLTRYLDIKTEYDISVGKGGPCCKFYHHYIVLESSYLPISSNRLIFELAKESDFMGKSKVVPNVRKFSRDGEPDYKITVKTTLRYHSNMQYSGTSLLRTLWDQTFLATFCCNIEVFLFQRLKMYW